MPRLAHYILLLFLLLLPPFALMKSANAAIASGQGAPDEPSSSYRTVKTRSGDTLRKIAQRLNVPLADLVRLNGIGEDTRLSKGTKIHAPVTETPNTNGAAPEVVGNRITLADGYSFEADEVWKNGDEVWFRKGRISQRLEKSVSSVRPIIKAVTNSKVLQAADEKSPTLEAPSIIWINLVGGARFRVDHVQETGDGAWYSRANLSIFMERERIAGIERELPGLVPTGQRNRDWTSGNVWVDGLIKTNGERYGLDPYLVFLVMEHESHFRQRAVSPKGARGLMQLMPGTARRLGVRDSFDPAQNIMGGTRYLKELMTMFGGRVDLALASYNAGEGAVMKFGREVPPYKETRNYVRNIKKRYEQQENSHSKNGKSLVSSER
jgi:murein DD-endopeptidase MepM/ murein hydrolase activator NlpD